MQRRLTWTLAFLMLCMMTNSLKTLESHIWKGYAPQCEQDCKQLGEVCDIGKESVCCMTGNCNAKFGLTACSAPLLTFTCNPVPQDELIKKVIDPKLFPNLYNKP